MPGLIENIKNIRAVLNDFAPGMVEEEEGEVAFEIWVESNRCSLCGNYDLTYLKTFNEYNTKKFLEAAKGLHPIHLFKVQRYYYDCNDAEWKEDEDCPFASAEEYFDL
jgi:hypothetical protein